MAMTTKKMMDAYNERQKKQVSKSENNKPTGNKPGGKSPARLAAEAKKAKLMSEVGTNKTNTKSVLGVTDFKNKKPVGNTDMKGGKRDPMTMSEKNTLQLSKIAKAAKNPTPKGVSQGSTMAKKPAPKKNPIVTPKMIKDAGYTNLRDYMNAKQGKTRRDGKTASRTAAAKKKDMMSGSFKGGGSVKKMMGGGMTKGTMMKYRGGGIVQQGARPTKYI